MIRRCDGCDTSLDRGDSSFSPEPLYTIQAMPPGETINGRSWIILCGDCIEKTEADP